MKKKISLFLDSGAFSAWSKKTEVDIDDYIDFIKKNKQFIDVYANLDVIGDAEGTYKNQKYMERQGLDPMPVFHSTMEPLFWFEKYLDEGYDYIGLGGMAGGGITKKQITPILDVIFSRYVCSGLDGMPVVKIHGFGMTSLSLMLRYPWYSVDSTSWVLTGRFGAVFCPRKLGNGYDYSKNSWKVSVSDRSPDKKDIGQHISTFSENEKHIILNYFSEKGYVLGKSVFRQEDKNYSLKDNERWFGKAKGKVREVEEMIEPGLCNDYKKRDELNIIYFLDLEKNIPKWPWPFKLKSSRRLGLI
ncbi:hypothetical protein LCGC14_1367270 [marine sediment metagenome]|uniref:Uncharacterized protein n=1 Tax=marine sediment metagenome TaxID=412755 RepID=A0A0F9K6D2_9ZZZZ